MGDDGDFNENVSRLEFDNFIAEFEGFRDVILDQISSLKHDLEVLTDKLEDFRKETLLDSPRSQSKLL